MAGTEHRIGPTRTTRAAVLPGQALVVLDLATMLVLDAVSCHVLVECPGPDEEVVIHGPVRVDEGEEPSPHAPVGRRGCVAVGDLA